MVRVNLFDPVRRSIYGTATTTDLLEVICFALLFCLCMGVYSLRGCEAVGGNQMTGTATNLPWLAFRQGRSVSVSRKKLHRAY